MATPPESPRERRLRSSVIWSFWIVIALLGFPIWYYTTSIYRAALPTSSMLQNDHHEWYATQHRALLDSLPPEIAFDIQESASRAFKPSAEYHLTFSLFTAGPAPSSWDIRPSLEHYIQPILHALSSTTNISVTSQVQLYSSLSPSIQPQRSEAGWTLQKEDLTAFINTAEWPLSPSVGSGPTIHFIAYIPDKKYIPLHLQDSPSNSWLIPQWGGITILNPPLLDVPESELGKKMLAEHLDERSLVPAFQNFQQQLLQLLGVPKARSGITLAQRLEIFQKLSALSLYSQTSSNLQSLARLSERLSMIPIPKHVLSSVEDALRRLSEFKDCFGNPNSRFGSCFFAVRDGTRASNEAFFDKSMVGQVYFPDEHKIAVYLPLLGPIGVPLVVGLLSELRTLIKRQ